MANIADSNTKNLWLIPIPRLQTILTIYNLFLEFDQEDAKYKWQDEENEEVDISLVTTKA